MQPRVSVVMTTFNAEGHVRESLESVLSQTLRDLEVVVVDGHSSDGTAGIVEEIIRRDPRVRLVYQDRPTIGAAKNIGMEQARGDFIAFLDADDLFMERDSLERLCDAADRTGCGIVGGLRNILYLDSGKLCREELHRQDIRENPGGVRLRYRDRQYDYHFHTYIYDRSMVMGSDARFAEVTAYDDTRFFIRAMMCAGEFYVVPTEFYLYRCGEPYRFTPKQAEDAASALKDQISYSAENGLAMLHWLTLQRINWEYGGTFLENMRSGDDVLRGILEEANLLVDPDLVDSAVSSGIPFSYYEPMLHMPPSKCPLVRNPGDGPIYLFEPIRCLIYGGGPPRAGLASRLRDALEKRRNRS